jgi:ribose transport system substrate-binding protein
VSKFKGRTVYYMPLVQQIPGFVVTAATMKAALAKAGLSLQVCNGPGQPSPVAACVQGMASVVIPAALAPTA